MHKENIQALFKYNQWANAKILTTASNLTSEQFLNPGTYPHSSIRGTLTHAVFAEWVWRQRWEGVSPTSKFKPEDFPTFDSLQTRWVIEEQALMKFVDEVTEEQINKPFEYVSMEGKKFENILWESMTHVVNHSTQHRAEAAAMLTDLGHSPGDLDMIIFFRKSK